MSWITSVYEPLPDLDSYLQRIGYTGTRELTRENLNALVYAHQCTVPFENLDCCRYGEPIRLDIPHLYEKIVTNRRGGYCFELNGAFAAMLRAFGFDAYTTTCRLARGEFPRPVMHRGCVIRLDGKTYFCDVGFGGPMAPFAVELSAEPQTFYGETYWITALDDGWYRLCRRKGEGNSIGDDNTVEAGEAPVAFFPLTAFMDEDFSPFSYQCSAIPTARFVTRLWANLRTPTGYKSLINTEYTVVVNGVKTVTEIPEDKLDDMLLSEFGIKKCEYLIPVPEPAM